MYKSITKKSIGFTFAFVLFFSAFFSITPTVSAFYYQNTRHGNGFHYAWYDPSVAQYGYTAHFNDGRTYWNQSPEIGIGKSDSYQKWNDKYVISTSSVPGLVGEVYNAVYVTDSSGTYAKYGSGEWADLYWDFCNVVLYDNTMKQQSPYNQTYVSRNAAHEIGHSIKMDHELASTDTVMSRGWKPIPGGSGNITITTYDKNNAYAKWKNY